MTDETLDLVQQFHDAFDVPTPAIPFMPKAPNRVLYHLRMASVGLKAVAELLHDVAEENNGNTLALRAQLMTEELGEVLEALANRDLEATLHELQDLRVVENGTILELGLGRVAGDAFRRVHRANMSKLGEDGKPIKNGAGRVVKGPNFAKATMKGLL
jgi:predicted HAD superfamily Cof-like phosphohydrolase